MLFCIFIIFDNKGSHFSLYGPSESVKLLLAYKLILPYNYHVTDMQVVFFFSLKASKISELNMDIICY